MKAIVCRAYGDPDVLEFTDVEKPAPMDDQVLVKVYAASINSWDWDFLRGKPRLFRLFFGLFRPRYSILGADIAGTVETIGKNVNLFQTGDEVFGDISAHWGGFAEYVCVSEKALALKPAGMKFGEAAAIPQAAVLALQGLRDKRPLVRGAKVLINGAGGGVGTFAVQMAKSFGAEVTGVDSTDKLDMLRSLGADHVIDYTREDFTRTGQQYDLILDVVATRSIFAYKRALLPHGIFVMVGGSLSTIFQAAFLGPFVSMTGSRKIRMLVHQPNKDIEFIKDLFAARKVIPVIDKSYKLSEAADAMRYFGEGLVRGKIVITIKDEATSAKDR